LPIANGRKHSVSIKGVFRPQVRVQEGRSGIRTIPAVSNRILPARRSGSLHGVLKRGFWNHDRFCRNASDIQPATGMAISTI